MADINLKDEKRISVKGEYDLVTTHPNNEPIYRSNGHQLKLNASNSDFISAQFSNTTITETSDIDLEFEFYLDSFSGGRIRLFHFSDENGEGVNNNKSFWFETSTTRSDVLFRQSNSDGSVVANAKNLGSPIIGVNRVKILNGEAFLNGVKTSIDPNNYTLDITNPYLKIAKFFNVSSFTDLTQLNFIVQGETFNPTNINENAQIEGSNGTIAQVNSSAADPINYILGTVFQKRGFALAFDAGNSEYVEIEPINSFTTINNFQFNIDLEINNDISNDYYFVINTSGLIFRIRTGSSFFVVEFIGLSLGNQTYFSPSLSGLNKVSLSISNGVLTYNGVAVKTFNDDDISALNNKRVLFGTNGGVLFNNGRLYSVSIQGENYPLKRGLGVELIGSNGTTAEIKTSAANPQQRVNFGMWQKNGNVLKLNGGNSDYLEFDDFTFENGTSIKLNIRGNFGSVFFPFSNEGLSNNFILLTPSQFQIRFGSGASDYSQSGLVIPTNGEYEFSYNNDTVSLVVDGVNVFDLETSGESMVLNTLNSRATGSQSTINLNGFELGSEQFLLREGNGLTTTSESGNTTATINTSAANPTEYIDTYVWNKDNTKFIDYKV